MQIITLHLDDIKPYEKNPRKNDGAVDQVAASIKEFGFKVPIIIDKDNIIVAGHTRYKAAKKLGLTEVPCIKADDLNEDQIKAFRLADNKVSEAAEWDMELLGEELADLQLANFDMEQFGFETAYEEENKEIIEDEAPEPPAEPKSKLGQIYQLGNHRLMCGDSTNEEDLAKLMDGAKADMVFTDPPYGMKKENDGVANDNLNYDDLLEFNKLWIPLTFKFLKNVGSWYCWGTDEPLMDIYSEILKPMKKQVGEMKLTFRNLITWDKGSGQGQLAADYRMYPIADEKCLFVMRGRQTYGDTIEDYWEGFDPIREAITKLLKDDLNLTLTEVEKYAGATTVSHWFAKSQWEFPAEERLKQYLNTLLSVGKISRQEFDKIRQEFDKIRQEWYNTRAYFDNTHDNMNDVWHFPKTAGAERESAGGHATPKPIALCSRAIKSSSRPEEIVLDVFGGSGSTLIACEQTNRKAYLMELEPQWVDVIIQRWENFTGRKAQLISEEEKERIQMFEKVNPSHPDKVADRIAGAIVDLAYTKEENPKIAVEVLIGHGVCHIICESSVSITDDEVAPIVDRIVGVKTALDLKVVEQDQHLAENQKYAIRCGDNGIFKGMPVTKEQQLLTDIAKKILYVNFPTDGKFIITSNDLVVCQSNAHEDEIKQRLEYLGYNLIINPLGEWTGGPDVDSGATNRKLGSDMADSVTGGGLHGKDLSKADVSINIYAWLKAQETGEPVELACAIGNTTVDGKPYSEIVEIAREFINKIGGFEKFAEWGLIR